MAAGFPQSQGWGVGVGWGGRLPKTNPKEENYTQRKRITQDHAYEEGGVVEAALQAAYHDVHV